MVRQILIGMLVSAGAIGLARSDSPSSSPPEPKRVQDLVQELGSEIFVKRERASKELEAMGPAIIEALREATTNSDLEISRRATELVRKAEDKINTAAFLKPKLVRLDLQDATIIEAVAQLSKLSGYSIHIIGDTTKLAQRKISFKTDEITFWEAFDKLCQDSGLVEVNLGTSSVLPASSRLFKQPAGLPAPFLPAAPVAQEKARVAELLAQLKAMQPNGGALIVSPSAAQRTPILVVRDGEPRRYPTFYQGSLRIRVLPAGDVLGKTPLGLAEQLVILDISPEPRFHAFAISGKPRIEKATDDQGQSLETISSTDSQGRILLGNRITSPGSRTLFVRLKPGEKRAKLLKELSGKFGAEAFLPPEAVLTIDDPLKAVGKTEKTKDGRTLTIQSLQQLANGNVELRARLNGPVDQTTAMRLPAGGAVQFAAKVQIAGNVRMTLPTAGISPEKLPVLIDGNGKTMKFGGFRSSRVSFDGIVMSQEFTATYRSDDGQAAPVRLVLNGQRKQMVQVPFVVKDIPLQ